MDECEFFLVTPFDGERWQADEIVERNPIPRVRELLGGKWERSSQYMPTVKAFFSGDRRVLVMGFPPGKTRDEVMHALRLVQESREDDN